MSAEYPGQPQPQITAGQDQPIQVRLAAPDGNTSSGGDTQLHAEILGRLLARKRLSRRKQQDRFEQWIEVDEAQQQFVDLTRKAALGDGTRDAQKKEMPVERAIMIPASYAIGQVRITQMLGLYLKRDPPLQVAGSGPEDIEGAPNLDAVLAYDMNASRYPSVMHSMLRDADRYGVGVVYDTWETEEGWVYPPRDPQALAALRASKLMPQKEWQLAREFNRWMNVDPYQFYPDPRIPLSLLQEGEFIGHGFRRGSSWLLSQKPAGNQPGVYFNIDQAVKMTAALGASARTTDAQMNPAGGSSDGFGDFGLAGSPDEKDRGYHRLDHLQVRLVPKDWKLSPEDRPQIWWFTLCNENTIIRAHPCPYDHERFTYAAAEVNPDPHTIHNPGMMELLLPCQRLINWLYNSHYDNVRKHLNDNLIVVASMIELQDLLNRTPGQAIRYSQAGEKAILGGSDPSAWVRQLEVSDVTQQHLATASGVIDFMQRMSASNDPSQGAPLAQDKTLGEVQSIIAASSARLAITVQLIDSMAMRPLCERAISNRQQLTSMQQWFRIVGDPTDPAQAESMQRLQLDRWDLQGNYDYVAHSSILPTDPARSAQFWLGMLQTAAAYPFLTSPQVDGTVLDLKRIFNKAAVEGGARNIQEFYQRVPPPQPQPPQVVPDAQMQRMVQAGNAVPLSQVQPQGPTQ